MAIIKQEISIAAGAVRVFQRIDQPEQIGLWWSRATRARRDDGADQIELHPGLEHGAIIMEIVRSAEQFIEWKCVSKHPASSPASAWSGTTITFDLEPVSDATKLTLTHKGWDEDNRWFAFCSYQWAMALQSLARSLGGEA